MGDNAGHLGDNFVKVGEGKWRSLDGTRQFRITPVIATVPMAWVILVFQIHRTFILSF